MCVTTHVHRASPTTQGTCTMCSNVNCASNQYRKGSCEKRSNGYSCHVCSNSDCGDAKDKYRCVRDEHPDAGMHVPSLTMSHSCTGLARSMPS